MKCKSMLAAVLASCAVGCARPPAPALQAIGTVAVVVPNNRTGDPLLIAGASFAEKYVLPTERYTVPDALAAEARAELARRGFEVVRPQLVDAATAGQSIVSVAEAAQAATRAGLDAAVLFIEIRRWEPDVPLRPEFVIASVAVTLVEPSSGRVLWRADHPSRPVPTPGVINVGEAYSVAAHKLMIELLTPLMPVRPAS
jgi:hypothetical protein